MQRNLEASQMVVFKGQQAYWNPHTMMECRLLALLLLLLLPLLQRAAYWRLVLSRQWNRWGFTVPRR